MCISTVINNTCSISGCMNEAAFSKYNLDWCNDHQYYAFNVLKVQFRGPLIEKGLEVGFMTHSEGLTYVIALPNGNLKIGTTRDVRTLKNRMLTFADEFWGVIKVLAVFEAGMTMESFLHYRFAEYRITNLTREQFLDVPEIREYAEDYGIPDYIKDELHDLDNVSY